MIVLTTGNEIHGEQAGRFGQIRTGLIYPGPDNKVRGHVHPSWHVTIIMRGDGVLRTDSRTLRVRSGDAVEIAPEEVHELEALYGPLEYMCVGAKGF